MRLRCLLKFVSIQVSTRRKHYRVSNWDNPVFDAALMLTITSGHVTGRYAEVVHEFVKDYVQANGTTGNGVGCAP